MLLFVYSVSFSHFLYSAKQMDFVYWFGKRTRRLEAYKDTYHIKIRFGRLFFEKVYSFGISTVMCLTGCFALQFICVSVRWKVTSHYCPNQLYLCFLCCFLCKYNCIFSWIFQMFFCCCFLCKQTTSKLVVNSFSN